MGNNPTQGTYHHHGYSSLTSPGMILQVGKAYFRCYFGLKQPLGFVQITPTQPRSGGWKSSWLPGFFTCMVYLPTVIIKIRQMWVKRSNLTCMIWIRPSHVCQDFSDPNSKPSIFWVRIPGWGRSTSQTKNHISIDLSCFDDDFCQYFRRIYVFGWCCLSLKQIRLNKHFSMSFCEFAPMGK